MDKICLDIVLALTDEHGALGKNTWRNEGADRWLLGLLEEVGELALALGGMHEHGPDHELKQIASICLNWLDMRNV